MNNDDILERYYVFKHTERIYMKKLDADIRSAHEKINKIFSQVRHKIQSQGRWWQTTTEAPIYIP